MNNKLALVVNFTGAGNLSGYVKNIVGLGKKGSQSIREMNAEARKLTREIAEYDRRISRTSGSVNNLWDQQKAKMLELEAVQKRINREERLMAIEADRQAGLRRADDLKNRGQANIMGGAAMAAPIILAVKAGADFSSTMVDIQQKANLSDRATAGLRNNIIDAARSARQLPAEMAAAVDSLAGLGFDPSQAVAASLPMGRFMTAFKVDGVDAAQALYAGFSNLNIPLSQTGKLLDIMAEGQNRGAFEARDMAAAFPGLAAQMKGLGQSGTQSAAELVAMLEVVRAGSRDSATAATNAENLLAKLTAPVTVDAFAKKFGIDLPAAIKRGTKAGISPLQTVIELTKKATGGDLAKLGYVFGDMQAGSAMRQLILDYDKFLGMRKELAATSGAVDKGFDTRVTNDQTVQFKELTGSISEMVLTASPLLIPFVKQVTDTLKSGVTAVTAFAKAHPYAAGMMLKLVSALAVGRVVLGGLQFAFGGILKPLTNVFAFFKKVEGVSKFTTMLGRLKTVGQAVGPVFNAIRTAAIFMGKGFMRAGLMLMANPIALAIAAVVLAVGAAAYLIYTHWDKIKAAFWQGVAWVKEKLGGLPDWLKGIGRMMMDGLLLAINPMALGKKLIDMAKYGIQQFKAYLGIKSPSRVFMAMGGHIAGGLERGIDGARHGPARATRRMAAGVLAAGSLSLAAGGPAMARPGGMAAPTASAAPITIHVHAAPGMDVKDLAREVRRELEAAQAQKARASYADDH